MLAPGSVRDVIVEHLALVGTDQSVDEIHSAVRAKLGAVGATSVRSYLRLNSPPVFERTARGRYRLAGSPHIDDRSKPAQASAAFANDLTKLYQADCFDWLSDQPARSIHAVVTDPPYGLVEFSGTEIAKLRSGKGGVWRVPPSFDGHQRSPLPRFTTLDQEDRTELFAFFKRLALHLKRITVPGANVVVASNPLLAHIVASAMSEGGLELRGYIARMVMTMRGGDRPKNAHVEFSGISVMPRSMWEPWVILRSPLDGKVSENLRRWKTGGFKRPSEDRPFGDLIQSGPTSAAERKLAPHPSLKPQAILRQIVSASLPLGEGLVLDPFAGSGSTLAAACAVGYPSIGVEIDAEYVKLASDSIPRLAALPVAAPTKYFYYR